MSDTDYIPSPTGWVRDQVEKIEATGDTRSVHIMNLPVVMLTMRGKKTGGIRKVPLMRVEHEGVYAAVASKGGAPEHPQWYANLRPTRRSPCRTAPSRGPPSPGRSPAPSARSGGRVVSRPTRRTPTTRPRPTG